MKHRLIPLFAGLVLFAFLGAAGCGTTTSTTKATTRATTSAQTTQATTSATTEISATTPSASSDITLPDIDNPITDVEPNIPESGVTDMTENGIDDIISDIMPEARGRTRDANRPHPALPTK